MRSRIQSRKLGHMPLSSPNGCVLSVPCCTVLRGVPQTVSLCHAQDVHKQSDKQQLRGPVLLKSASCCTVLLYFRGYCIVTLILVFPEVVYGCESWTVKKTECRRIDAFELWCWRRLLRVPWTASRSNQSVLKISPGCSLEGLMLKLKLQYFGHLQQRVDSLEKTHAERDWGQEEKGMTEDEMAGWRHPLDGRESE